MRSALLLAALALPSSAVEVRVSLRAPVTYAPLARIVPQTEVLSRGFMTLTPSSFAPGLSPAPSLTVPTLQTFSPAPLPLSIVVPQDAGQAPTGPAEVPGPGKVTPEQSVAEGAKRFDGAAKLPADGVSVPFTRPADISGALPASISVADPKDSEWLASVIAAAKRSRTGRKILKQIDALAVKRGRPLTMVVTRLEANNGEYSYDWEMVRMGAHFRKKSPEAAAPILMHELLHVVQKEDGLPTDAVELELEAFAVTMMVHHELGIPFPARSFEKAVDKKFRSGTVKEFVAWLLESYETNISITGGIDEYLGKLTERHLKHTAAIERLEKKIKRQEAIIEKMRLSGQPKDVIETYATDILTPIKGRLLDKQADLKWIERDMEILSTPEGVARYRAYRQRVMRMLQRYHKHYAERYP